MKKIKEVTIVIDYMIYVYLFEPIVRYLLQRNVKVVLCVPDNLQSDIKSVIGSDVNLSFISLTEIKLKNKFRFVLHRICSILFTRTDFSFQFKKRREQSTKKVRGGIGLLLRISRFTPKVPNVKINKFLSYVSGIGLKNPFPTENVIVGSLNASAELLGGKNLRIITIMESWDHAVKDPNGYVSDIFFGWNQDLCDDWKAIQGDEECRVFHPLKLRYAHEQFCSKPKIREFTKQRRRVLYPVASTAKFSIGILVEIEKKLIYELINITKELGWELYIKPRPNGMTGEFDYAKEFEHVEVGDVSHADIINPADYYYSEQDNVKRFAPLQNIDLVINAFTTFGLDAAVANIPVLQLDLRQALNFEDSSMVYNNYHIKKYLISTNNLLKPVGCDLTTAILENKEQLFDIAESYKKELNNWLFRYESSNDAIQKCFDKLLEI